VRDLRKRAGLSQEDLAEHAGVTRYTVYRTENATSAVMLDVLWMLADALGVHPRELLPDDPAPRE